MRPDISDFTELFLNDTPMMDTRAPLEFNKGAFPTAENLPLMLDNERAKVGTCYKKHGQEEAIKLGHQLVRGKVKQQRLDAWLAFAQHHPQGYLYCFRGGLRSQLVQQWMRDAGVHYPRVIGGYKALRQFLISETEWHAEHGRFVILSGSTGCGKTHLLTSASDHIDLEGLANHRGSAFGKRVAPQPSQIGFENALAIALLKQRHRRPDSIVLLEDESHLVGRCAIPMVFHQRMKQCPLVVLDEPLENRVNIIFRDYILTNLDDAISILGPDQGFEHFANGLRDAMNRIRKRLGGALHQQLIADLERALTAQQQGDPNGHRVWIETMLREYYDPMYAYQFSNKVGPVLFRGQSNEVADWLEHRRSLQG